MEIKFQTKAESKKEQQEEFLKLSGGERVWRFFALCAQINRFPRNNKIKPTENFVIHIDSNNANRKLE